VERLTRKGRIVFGLAIAALGVVNFCCAHFRLAMSGVPWAPVNSFLCYLTGAALVAAGLCIAANFKSRLVATLLGYLFLAFVLLRALPQVVAYPADWSVYGILCEALSLGAAAWILAQTQPGDASAFETALGKVTAAGPYFLAAALIVFGSIHFLVARFIASLIPAWIPGSLFWTYFTGTALIASGVSIAIRQLYRQAGFLLGIMFLLWFVLLHIPRVAANIHNPDEWSSAFIALAMVGASWIVASSDWHGRIVR